jgi:hypothetical protein
MNQRHKYFLVFLKKTLSKIQSTKIESKMIAGEQSELNLKNDLIISTFFILCLKLVLIASVYFQLQIQNDILQR